MINIHCFVAAKISETSLELIAEEDPAAGTLRRLVHYLWKTNPNLRLPIRFYVSFVFHERYLFLSTPPGPLQDFRNYSEGANSSRIWWNIGL